MDFKNFIQSKTFKKILWVIGGTLVFLIIFQAGVFVGYRKAAFSYHGGESYYRTFGGRGFAEMMGAGRLPNAHGAIGKIIKIELPTFVMEDRDQIEKVISITDDSAIRRFHDVLEPADLKVGDMVMVIGSPDNNTDTAEIEARLIRLLPAQENTASNATTSPVSPNLKTKLK